MIFTTSRAESLDLTIEVLSTSPARVRVSGKILEDPNSPKIFDPKRFVFLDAYADASNLSGRFSNLAFLDSNGKALDFKKKAVGEFETGKPASQWSYEANLAVPAAVMASAHVSWLNEQKGLLMLSDLLPQFPQNKKLDARVRFVLPSGWRIATNENKVSNGEFTVSDAERAVFLVGRDFRERVGWIGKTEFRLAIEGTWLFSEEEVIGMASQILEEHRRNLGDIATPRVQLFLMRFPRETSMERWRAETRGSTIVLLSGVYPFKSIAVNRLHEQLRHEIFHLWIPNALNLTGEYDWFYEGFTLYQALKTGVRLEYIRFEDFLDSMSRAFDGAQFAEKIKPVSLLEASKQRWRGGSDLVYAKGMVVAFLCDAAMLRQSGGKRSIGDVLRDLYRKHRFPTAPEEGNAAILSLLKKSPEAGAIIQKVVENSNTVAWSNEIAAIGLQIGLQNVSKSKATRLAVVEKPNGKQRDLLEKLGYRHELSGD